MDFTKQNYLELHQEVKFDEKIYKTELIDRLENVYVVGNIKLNSLDVLNLNLKLTGTMFLKDSVTLEEINYPFVIDIKEEYEINDENTAMVILYHEVMWYLMDNLIQDKVLNIPAVFKDEENNKKRLNEVVFFIEGGLMQ